MIIFKVIMSIRLLLAAFFIFRAFFILHDYLTERDGFIKSGEKIFPFADDGKHWLFWLAPYIVSILDFIILCWLAPSFTMCQAKYYLVTVNGVLNVVAGYFAAEVKSSTFYPPSWVYGTIGMLYACFLFFMLIVLLK